MSLDEALELVAWLKDAGYKSIEILRGAHQPLQPSTIAGHMLDEWENIHGEGSVTKATQHPTDAHRTTEFRDTARKK